MQSLATANNKFGFQAFQQLCRMDKGQNVFISPTSLAQALQMTYNGATGDTKAAMEKALALNGLSLEQINAGSKDLRKELLAADPKVQINIANSLWIRPNAGVKQTFVQQVEKDYSAEVGQLTGSPEPINAWVAHHTHDKIKTIVSSGDVADAVAVLANAVYFKGSWTKPFEKTLTKNDTFTMENGEKKSVKLMAQTGHFSHYSDDDLQAAQIPYGNGRYSMLLMLPNPGRKLSDLASHLTADTLDKWTRGIRSQEGTIKLPRFKSEYDASMNDALNALGMGVAFSDQADFSKMGHHLFISQVKHKTFVDVNEVGTEAAAATAVIMMRSAVMRNPQPPFMMILNRPFFCAIRENQTGALLFLGAINAPDSQ